VKASRQRLGVGIVGMGAAGCAFVPALQRHPAFAWVAFAETDDETRAQWAQDPQAQGVVACDSLQMLLGLAAVDVVLIATPTPLHAQQVRQACAAGRHVIVEKPMAISLAEGAAMVQAAERAGVKLLVGHSHSFDLPIRRMRDIVAGGELGPVRMVNTWCFTDWMRRPRRPDERDATQGGGVVMRQGAHQFDVLRLLAGGRARSVRAQVFDWDRHRAGAGAHSSFVEFDGGVTATAVYNGYGGLASKSLCHGISEWGLGPETAPVAASTPAAARAPQAESMPAGVARALGAEVENEAQAKRQRARRAIPAQAPYQPFFGLTVVSCEGGDLRQSPTGLWVDTPSRSWEIALPTDRSPREHVLDELAGMLLEGSRPLHDGRWGLATLELCLAVMRSARLGRAVGLQHQVPVPAGA